MVGVSTLVFAVLLVLYVSKFVLKREAVMNELRHPVKLRFFPTISISLLLLATAYLPLYPTLAEGIWILGASLQLLFTLFVINTWMHHEHFEVGHINPAWFIPAVGNVLVPIAGMPLGYVDVAWFFFSVGMLFWVVLLTIIFYRVLFHNPIDHSQGIKMHTQHTQCGTHRHGHQGHMNGASQARHQHDKSVFQTLPTPDCAPDV